MKKSMLALSTDDTVVQRFEQQVWAREAEARYPQLLTGLLSWRGMAHTRDAVLFHDVRTGSGLTSVAVLHGALSPEQRHALGEFRLHQYLLWHWYDTETILANGIRTDPALDRLPPDTVHLLVGTPNGRLLAYFTMQPTASGEEWVPNRHRMSGQLAIAGKVNIPCMGDSRRPWFACEFESFGPTVFSSLPALSTIPVARVRELPCLLRNRVVQSPLGALAVLEAIYVMSRVQVNSWLAIRATIGIMDIEARQVTAYLGIPTLYAPSAKVVRNELAYFWAEGMNEEGKFWPFAIATDDLLTHPDHFKRIESMLDLPVDQARRAMVQLRRHSRLIEPSAFVPAPNTSPLTWTSDPLWGFDRRQSTRDGQYELATAAQLLS